MPLAPRALCPYLVVRGAAQALDFYVRAFGAEPVLRLTDPGDGRIGHAELRLGNTLLFLADEYPEFGAVAPDRLGGSPVKLHLEVDDTDAFVAQAVQAGAQLLRAPRLEFHGHRNALLADPHGYQWFVSQQVEDLDAQAMQSRWQAMYDGEVGGQGTGA